MLEANHVTKSFDHKTVIEDVTVHLNENEIVAVVGASGVGKTTLFNIIAGALLPDDGEVLLNGKNITGSPGKVSYMLQKDMLLPYKTVLSNVALPLILKGEKKKYAMSKAQAYFSQFGLIGTENQYPAELSGGMKQRAAFLRTYLFSSQVSLLDEPFSALDAITKQSMHEWYLDMMSKLSMSAFFITHDINEAIFLADRVYVISGLPGKVVGEIKVEIPRPRNRETVLTEKFTFYKKQIMALLDER
jgi:ABC-type nitrate/sulfonate/bicarbonate transport system ATPase subunit